MAIVGAAQIRRAGTEPGLQARSNFFFIVMIHIDDVLVLTPKITPVEALVGIIATWKSDEEVDPPLPALHGQMIGPLCEYADTLSDRIPLQRLVDREEFPNKQVRARVRVLEPCFWAPEHPFMYELSLELWHGNQVQSIRRIMAGIRHLSVARHELLLNGQETFLKGIRHSFDPTAQELEMWHEVDCTALLVSASEALCARTDRWGPMVLHALPRTKEEVRRHVVQLRNHPSVLTWVLPSRMDGQDLDEIVNTIKAHDPSRPIGQLVAIDEPILTEAVRPVDLYFLPDGHRAIGAAALDKPYVVLADRAADPDVSQFENFTNQTDELCQSLGSPQGLVGVIL